MTVLIPGFPIPMNQVIDFPDIAELLMYPQFQCIDAEDYRRYATDFQRYLLDQLPLKNDKGHVLIRSGVSLLEPGVRSHTGGNGDWHIDGIGPLDHVVPLERVHIVCSPCKALTEFNLCPLAIEALDGETRQQFCRRIRACPSSFGVVPQAIQPGRVYTFENHLHRAVEPSRIEFRFFFRVRETDEVPETRKPLTKVHISAVQEKVTSVQIRYDESGVWVARPRAMQPSGRMLFT